ncbi:MAG: serine hydrolase domain-containing protein [Anaerolineae bacterium]
MSISTRFKNRRVSAIAVAAFTLVMTISPVVAQVSEPEPVVNDPAYQAAADYSAEISGDALLVYRDGVLVFEEYQNTYDPSEPHLLASGTKSFSCAIANLAIQDGLLSFDEPVADTITEWAADPIKRRVTVRQLLSLTSGLQGGSFRRGADNAALNINETAFISDPGEDFHYGPSGYYVFAELMRRKLGGGDVWDYLTGRVLDPLGIQVSITRDSANTPALASGGRITARDWARYGQLILQSGMWNGEALLDPAILSECFIGSQANVVYGLTFWLFYENTQVVNAIYPQHDTANDGIELGVTAPEVIYAAGARISAFTSSPL